MSQYSVVNLNGKECITELLCCTIEIMNNPITNTEVETVIKNLQKKQKPRTRWLHRRILQII